MYSQSSIILPPEVGRLIATYDASSNERHCLLRFSRLLTSFAGVLKLKCNEILIKTIRGMPSTFVEKDLINLACENAASMIHQHYNYSKLAARLALFNLYNNTPDTFYEAMCTLQKHDILSQAHFNFVHENRRTFDDAILFENDFNYDYFGFKTLESLYLQRVNSKIVERPQYMLLRVAIGIHLGDVDRALETYKLMSNGYFTHATPTLFSAGTNNSQMSSCYLISLENDTVEGVFEVLKKCAIISKNGGGIGVNVSKVHCRGEASGLVSMLRVFNNAIRYVDQCGRRPGAIAAYLEPWHGEVLEFLEMKKNTGKEEMRARDLFYALWVPDLFMKRVGSNEKWSLMDPKECTGLDECYGGEFESLYERYENEGKFMKQIDAQYLWRCILRSQDETGTPYLLYKDSCNAKSNQKHLGTIKCSNLCAEIIQYTSSEEIAVCNLASLSLSKFVERNNNNNNESVFNFDKLKSVTKIATLNLNKIIDINRYPVEEAKTSNLKHRPIGIGVQGLADTFMMMRLPFESERAKELNLKIFETIYYAALEASCELAKEFGAHESYTGSPAHKGVLQFDMWNANRPDSRLTNDWTQLMGRISKYGLRNSLLVAAMPTASTSQILGNYESFEPITFNLYQRRVAFGTFTILNKYMVDDLVKLNLWNEDMRNLLLYNKGSIQNINSIPVEVRELYKTVWEMSHKTLIDMAADRGAFIDQSQSFNVYSNNLDHVRLTRLHFYAWRKGLKTGVYYLRCKPSSDPIQYTVDEARAKKFNETSTCARNNMDGGSCVNCSS